jgi:hypothetical protein
MNIEKLDPSEYKSIIMLGFGVPPYRRLINLNSKELIKQKLLRDDFVKRAVIKGGRLNDSLDYITEEDLHRPGLERGYMVDRNFLVRNKVMKESRETHSEMWYRIDRGVIKSIFDYYDKSLNRHLADKYKRVCCDTIMDTLFERTWGKDEGDIKDVFKDMFTEL